MKNCAANKRGVKIMGVLAAVASIIPLIIWAAVVGVGIYVLYLVIKALRIYIDKNS